MKILMVHNKYLSRYVGGEDVIFQNEVRALKERLGEDNVLEYAVSNDNLKKMNILFSVWYSFKHYREIYRIVKNKNIDLVHVHNFYPLLTTSIFRSAKKAGAKVVHSIYNYRWWCISGILYRENYGICEKCVGCKLQIWGIINKCYRNSLLQSFITALAFWFYSIIGSQKYIDKFFVISEHQKNKLLEFGLDNDRVILKQPFCRFNLIGNSKNKRDFIFVGRLSEEKGIKILLDVWKELPESYNLKIIGMGPYAEDFKKMNKKNIVYLGKQSDEDTIRYISNSKYLIHLSLCYETLGLIIIEAMSVGTPVIGLNIGTRKELIKNKINGFISDVDGLLNTIKIAHDYNDYETMSENAITFADNFNEDVIIKRQISIYEDIING